MHKSICCDPSSELSGQDVSDEGSQHMVSVRNKKNNPSIIIKYPLLSRALVSMSNKKNYPSIIIKSPFMEI